MPKRNRGPHLEWRPDRECWEVIWFERGKRCRRSTGTADSDEAKDFLADFLAGRQEISARDPSERLIADVLALYATERGPYLHGNGALTLACNIDALLSYWAEKTVIDVRESTCRDYVRRRGVRSSTSGRELGCLGAAINHDWKAGRLASSVPVWRPPQPPPRERWLTRSEAALLLHTARLRVREDPRDDRRATSRSRWYAALFIVIALYTGARKTAILNLRWTQVDLDRGLIDFNEPGRERTKKGRGRIPIPRRLMTFLRIARQRGTPTGFVLHDGGRPIGDIKKLFQRLAWAAWMPDVTPHTLRHTAASWMVQRGVPFPVVARYLGHSDSRTTERVYAHHAPDYLLSAAKALDYR
ncbi:MAG: site-specific integrase [Alphaproteobacteria bacterium]|nr:site-specific integrase [Alphaproteobacteria bacterium]